MVLNFVHQKVKLKLKVDLSLNPSDLAPISVFPSLVETAFVSRENIYLINYSKKIKYGY